MFLSAIRWRRNTVDCVCAEMVWWSGPTQFTKVACFAKQKVTFGSCIVKSWLEARPHRQHSTLHLSVSKIPLCSLKGILNIIIKINKRPLSWSGYQELYKKHLRHFVMNFPQFSLVSIAIKHLLLIAVSIDCQLPWGKRPNVRCNIFSGHYTLVVITREVSSMLC